MKVAEYRKYGNPEVLQITDRNIPEPKDDEVLIKIVCSTVTATEATFRKGKPYFSRLFTGLWKPSIPILGEEFSGDVVKVGRQVNKFRVGQKVFGTTGISFGAYAEFLCMPEDSVITVIPENMDYVQAAGSCDGFLTAYSFLVDTAKIQSGQSILIIGASGSIGVAAVQIAHSMGLKVTGVSRTENHNLIQSLGGHNCIDYTTTTYDRMEGQYDIVFDTVSKVKFQQIKHLLKEKGIFLESGIDLEILPVVLWTKLFSKKKVKISATGLKPINERLKDFLFITNQIASGIWKPVIDKIFAFQDISEAHQYVDTGHKKGNVILQISKQQN
ncbi:MAG: NAD(P)-dependent alcohol dehydrogenase [Leptospira sp.]|nr:NAD(P)-dependent alcohol dehydrogenase [Leptospira sp.]